MANGPCYSFTSFEFRAPCSVCGKSRIVHDADGTIVCKDCCMRCRPAEHFRDDKPTETITGEQIGLFGETK